MKVAYDIELMRPGCAVVQAGCGGDLGIANAFDSEDWVTHLTDNMRVYEVDGEQLHRLVILTGAHRKEAALCQST